MIQVQSICECLRVCCRYGVVLVALMTIQFLRRSVRCVSCHVNPGLLSAEALTMQLLLRDNKDHHLLYRYDAENVKCLCD